MFVASLVIPLTFFALSASAHRHQQIQHAHRHLAEKRLPAQWYHSDDHPVHQLFRRGIDTDGYNYPVVGSPEWQSAFTATLPDLSAIPTEWTNALNAAVAAGKIPDIPVSVQLQPNTSPSYPNGTDPTSPEVCSSTVQCFAPGVIYNAPDGFIGTGFDDGPQPPTDQLLDFLSTNNEIVTHFVIGQNIYAFPDLFMKGFNMGHDMAVHTYTHPYMTTQNNTQVLAELGYTMEIIRNSTGGRVPRFWRPPYGDSDNRVNAIAKEVFGLTTIVWNQDTADWSIPAGGTTLQAVNTSMTQWLTGPKSPGLIILEHELYNVTVQAFMDAYPVMKQNGWQLQSVTRLNNTSPYQNTANSDSAPVTPQDILVAVSSAVSSAISSAPTSSSSSTPSATSQTPGSLEPSSATNSVSPSSEASSGSKNAASRCSSTIGIGLAVLSGLCVVALLA